MIVNSKRKFDNGPTNNKKPFEVPKKKAIIGFAGAAKKSSSSDFSEDDQINAKIFKKTEHGTVEGGQLKRPMLKGPLDKMFS